jgi:phage terminase large subunit
MKFQIPKKLRPLVEKHKRFKVAFGGRGGAKSMAYAGIFTMKAQVENALIGCFREYQNSIEDSVMALIKYSIKEYQVPGFHPQKTIIDHVDGGGFRFRGLARSIEAVKSMHGFKYFWLEEGQFISADSLKILTPTLRESESELWISANPLSSADPFSQRFIVPFQKQIEKDGFYEDDLHLIIKINYRDNPWFPKELEAEREHDYKTLPRALYDHIWEGAFNDSVENSIIRTEWFDAAIDAHKKLGFKPEGAIVVAHDPSDLGTDDKAVVKRHGNVLVDAQLKQLGDVNEGCDWATTYANLEMADLFTWDADGMGISLKKQVKDSFNGKRVNTSPFRGSEGPDRPHEIYEPATYEQDLEPRKKTNKDIFANKRAQFYWKLRDRLYNTYLAVEKGIYKDPETLLSISSDIDVLPLLRSEICRVPRKFVNSGKIQIMSKDEMRKMKIQSPNLSDSVMMSLVTPQILIDSAPLVFDTYFD